MTPSYTADDGTHLAYADYGQGWPLVCLPGGPLQAAAYLGDLGRLPRYCRLILPDLRGTKSTRPAPHPTSHRPERLVADLETLRAHMGLDRMNLLGHSAGTTLALRYAMTHPDHVHSLTLVAPSLVAPSVHVTAAEREAAANHRSHEPWFTSAFAALTRRMAGTEQPGDDEAIVPFLYGRWDRTAQAHHAAKAHQVDEQVAAEYARMDDLDAQAVAQALTSRPRPVLIIAGEVDVNSPPTAVARLAQLLPEPRLVVQPKTGHFPWLDDPTTFTGEIARFMHEVRRDA